MPYGGERMKILFIGDIVGSIGRNIITTMIEKITSEEFKEFFKEENN